MKGNADLMWLEAYGSSEQGLYFGRDSLTVNNATPSSPEYKGSLGSNIYDPGELTPGEKFYWRVDAISKKGIEKGDVWSFNVGD